jgi:hypothetical protein
MEEVNLAEQLHKLTGRPILAADAPVEILENGNLLLIRPDKGWHIIGKK